MAESEGGVSPQGNGRKQTCAKVIYILMLGKQTFHFVSKVHTGVWTHVVRVTDDPWDVGSHEPKWNTVILMFHDDHASGSSTKQMSCYMTSAIYELRIVAN